MNYYERHLGDYAKDAGHLSMLEHGAYTLLLDRYYATEAPIPKADVYRVCRAASKPERAAVDSVLREFFTDTPDGWRSKRCDQEIARFADKRAKASRSANARWRASDGNANAYPDAMRTHSDGNALQSPDSNLQTPRVLQPSSPEPTVSASTAREQNALGLVRMETVSQPNQSAPVENLIAPEVSREAVDEWREHRQAIGKPLKPHELIVFGKVLRSVGTAADQLATVRTCVANGWHNLRTDDRPLGLTKSNDPLAGVTWRPTDDEEPARASA